MEEKEKELLDAKVLIVDDEANIRNIVRLFLEYHVLTVKTASDGDEALRIVEEENFDVILSDIMMPGMDGLTLAVEIRKVQPNAMVILMTGYASVNTAVEAIKRDVFDYILKPFQNMQIVLQSIKRAIERKRLLMERNALIDDLKSANEELAYNRGLLEDKISEIDSELSRRVIRLSTLYDISRSISSITNVEDLLNNIMDRILSVLNNTAGIFWLADNESKLLKKVVTRGVKKDGFVPESIGIIEGEAGETIRSDHVRIFRQCSEISDPVFKRLCEAENINSLILVPLRYENEILGLISMLFRDESSIKDDDVNLLIAIADQASVSIKNAELYSKQQRMFRETIEALATAINSRDHYTSGHSNMVTKYAVMIAGRMDFNKERLELIRIVGILHDVGKIGITDLILNKPDKLTDEEMGVIKAHPVLGRFILESIHALKPAARIIYHHHERYDGKGYPDGISGENIPLESRIIQIADIFDALTSDRIYRKALPFDEAVSIIREGLGTVSDPEVGKILMELIEEGKITAQDGE